MLTAISRTEWLSSAANVAGLFGAGKGAAKIEINPAGLMALTRPWPAMSERELLQTQADWRGPVKLRREADALVQRVDLFLGPLLSEEQITTLDDDELARMQAFLSDVFSRVPEWIDGGSPTAWQPPPARTIADWLNAAGHEAAIDKEGNLRLALKRRGCDGQIKVERRETARDVVNQQIDASAKIEPDSVSPDRAPRLRFSMLLGQWRHLDETAEQALLKLADEANSRTRLVRIAWLEDDETSRRCEAQVDLSGLPCAEPLEDAARTMWKETVRTAVDGLDLALRRLGLELNALAEPINRELAGAFMANERRA